MYQWQVKFLKRWFQVRVPTNYYETNYKKRIGFIFNQLINFMNNIKLSCWKTG